MHRLVLAAVFVGAGAASVLACAQSPLDKARRDEVKLVPSEDPDMEAAYRKARATLDDFLRIAASPPSSLERFSLKVAVREKGDTEYFWVRNFSADGNRFRGTIANTPRIVRNVKAGQQIEFSRADIFEYVEHELLKHSRDGVPRPLDDVRALVRGCIEQGRVVVAFRNARATDVETGHVAQNPLWYSID